MDFYPLFELTGSFFLFLTVLVDVLTRVSVCESVRKRCVDMGLADNVHTGKCVALLHSFSYPLSQSQVSMIFC